MFETVEAVAEDAVACGDALVAAIARERRAVAERFAHVAVWADFHSPGSGVEVVPDDAPARCVTRQPFQAGDGTPPVTPAGVVELGVVLQTSTYSAEVLLRDVLELRHRLPAHWAAVMSGAVDGWKARQVARLTHHLDEPRARAVDAQVIEAVVGLPWGRALRVVEAKVIAADPAAHEAKLAQRENRRFVSTGRRSDAAGLRTLITRNHAGDIARLEAMIDFIATKLGADGDADPADTRRAKALAMLANPALACLFLAQAQEQAPVADEREPEPDLEPDLGPERPSAVELGAAFGRVLRSLGAKAIERLRPRSVLYLHLSAEAVEGRPGCAVARADAPADDGPIGVEQLKAWLANDRVTVTPVLDPTGVEPVDGYEIPLHLRHAVHLLAPYEVFPHGTLPSRQATDIDHAVPYLPMDEGGPPGQTGTHNLGPLGRRHHLAKTFDGFTVHQLAPNLHLWRTPTGHWSQVDHRGTTYLGRQRPAVLDSAAAKLRPVDLSRSENRFREAILRHGAA